MQTEPNECINTKAGKSYNVSTNQKHKSVSKRLM